MRWMRCAGVLASSSWTTRDASALRDRFLHGKIPSVKFRGSSVSIAEFSIATVSPFPLPPPPPPPRKMKSARCRTHGSRFANFVRFSQINSTRVERWRIRRVFFNHHPRYVIRGYVCQLHLITAQTICAANRGRGERREETRTSEARAAFAIRRNLAHRIIITRHRQRCGDHPPSGIIIIIIIVVVETIGKPNASHVNESRPS